jgi:hypothetical protein
MKNKIKEFIKVHCLERIHQVILISVATMILLRAKFEKKK